MILILCGPAAAEVKDIGTPFIRNFAKSDYRAGMQSWAIAQDLKGFMYFANNDGLLVYDGVEWQVYRMPNLSMVRSIYTDYTGEVYVGAYNDIGKMVYSENGKMTFSSLKSLIPEEYRIYVDDKLYFTFKNEGTGYKKWPFDKRFHLLLNVAVGGNWGGAQGIDNTIFPRYGG
jgi:ligand-binding sensor domain-containing protein